MTAPSLVSTYLPPTKKCPCLAMVIGPTSCADAAMAEAASRQAAAMPIRDVLEANEILSCAATMGHPLSLANAARVRLRVTKPSNIVGETTAGVQPPILQRGEHNGQAH